MPEQAAALLRVLLDHEGADGVSLAVINKRLRLAMSQTQRLLSVFGESGLGWVGAGEQRGRLCVWLTPSGRQAAAEFIPAPFPAGAGQCRVEARTVSASGTTQQQEAVAEEVAVALVYKGISHAVMMASPLDLEDFALGFSLSEGIVGHKAELRSIECIREEHGMRIEIDIAEAAFQALKQRRRQLAGRTGCGLCGHESLEGAIRPVSHVDRDLLVSLQQVQQGLAALPGLQTLNQATGAVHAAALVHAGGVLLREDVGRHNALDKLIGAMARAELDEGFVIMSSRASYEVVHKAAAAGIPLLASISAPTGLAIRLAEEAGLTLIGFARDGRMTVYSHHRRVAAARQTATD